MSARILVLDTNLLLGAPVWLLKALVESGNRLTISVVALEERIAEAYRSRDIEPLRTRLRNMSPYIDDVRPFTPVGEVLFFGLKNQTTDDKRPIHEAYAAQLIVLWRELIAKEAMKKGWESLAEETDKSITRSADDMRKKIRSLKGVSKEGVTYGQVHAVVGNDVGGSPIAKMLGKSRVDAYISRFAQIALRAPQEPAANDVEDLALLEHLAEDVILTTGDYRMVQAVDSTGSMQAPFVRSAWEVLDGLAPVGPPWGTTALAAWLAHTTPRTSDSLVAHEDSLRVRRKFRPREAKRS